MIKSKQNHFPEKWITTFQGIYYCNGLSRFHTFISFTGGKTWQILDKRIDKFIFVNHGGLIFAIERRSDIIWYSYDDGNNWYDDIRADFFKDIFTIESPNNLIISALNVNEDKNIHSFNKYNFSDLINRTCQNDDFEPWYVPRYYENCFESEEAFYLKKKPSSMCFDDRTVLLPVIEPCQCVRDGFLWYSNIIS
ncbi:Vacuolar protein sorting/targeting protein 10 [Thelohanellus kitauei]|uniref:Vacuolar protein sorting/targeting protein 10 n=1 Tax=Thelohanellus kitauei TaxID=669202 RepID=A0A0C2IW16_THEKT|nr:Vacuolar protein sorting/targeting protein 10 [Thelohanellus kitauei]